MARSGRHLPPDPPEDGAAPVATAEPPAAAAEEETPARIIARTKQEMACTLTDEEQRDRGRQLARVIDDMKNEEASQHSAKAMMKQRIADLESRRDKLVLAVSRGEEQREVEIVEMIRAGEGIVVRVRMDTEEVLSQRAMEAKEAQLELVPGGDTRPPDDGEERPDVDPDALPEDDADTDDDESE